MPGIYLRLETIAGGTIERGFVDAVAVAEKLGIWVMMKVNGIDTMIGPSDDPKVLNTNYERAVKLNRDFVSSTVPPVGHG